MTTEDDEQPDYIPTKRVEEYPFELVSDTGDKYTIIKTLSFKFLTSTLKINGENADFIMREKPSEKEIIINCRIRLMEDDKENHLVVITDDIYHTIPLVIKVPNKNYTYNIIADAIEYCKKLGYHEAFTKTRFSDIYEKNMRLKGMKYKNWWDNNRNCLTNVM